MKLTVNTRNNLPKADFGLPGQRKYPVPDEAHAINAKARASQQFNKGNLSATQKAQIDAKANKVMNHHDHSNDGHSGSTTRGIE